MTTEIWFVFGLIAVAAALMASNRVRFDVIAILVVLALMLSDVLSVDEALAGFGSSVVIIVAGLLVVGEMLDRTGVARAMGDLILKKGGTSETRLLILIMTGAALLSSVMSSTAVVAIFIPIVLRIARETKLNVSRLCMPMSYAALISGMLTLIATTPNIVVSEELKDAGVRGFGFFTFTPVGLVVLVVAIAYMVVIGRRLLPEEVETEAGDRRDRSISELAEAFNVNEQFDAIRIGAGSPLVGKALAETGLGTRFGVRVVGIQRSRPRGKERIAASSAETELRARDVMIVVGEPAMLDRLIPELELERTEITAEKRRRWLREIGGAALLVHPESRLIEKSLRESDFRSRYGLHVLGVRRAKQPMPEFESVRLQAADSFFVVGPWARIEQLRKRTHDFIVTELPRERADVVQAHRKMPVALLILASMVLLTLFNVVPLAAAVVMAALAAVLTRCLTMEDAYRSIHWSSIVLVAGMLPLATALDVTGGTKLIVDAMLFAIGDAGPRAVLTVVFFVTAVLSLFLSNTAAAVLVAPVAIYIARVLNVSPYPIAVAVVIAASSGYATPVSSPVVTLVVEPGRYKFTDFVKVGGPLLILTYLVTVLVAPIIFPFDGFEWPVGVPVDVPAP